MKMYTSQSVSNNLLWIEGHAVNPMQLDSKDMESILSQKGLVPLGVDEREYINSLVHNLNNSNLALIVLLDFMSEKEVNIEDLNEITDSLKNIIEVNTDLLEKDADNIGRGLKWI